MNKINNKLILILGILTFIIIAFLPTETKATVYKTYNDSEDPAFYFHRPNIVSQQNNSLYQNTTGNSTVIPGCEGRNTGYSTTTSQSCVGNYINNTNTTNNNPPNNSSSTSSSTTTKNSYTTDNNNTTVSENTNTNKTVTTNNTNDENFGSLTANALIGSNSFMPTGLVQWIILIMVILAIIFLWRYVYAEEEYLAEPLKHS